MTLGDNIRRLRKTKGWSQRELADQVSSTSSYINRVETGKVNPSIGVLERIAKALGCSLDQMVKAEEPAEIHVRDKAMMERVKLIDSLDEADRDALLHMIDTMLTKKRVLELLSGKASPTSV